MSRPSPAEVHRPIGSPNHKGPDTGCPPGRYLSGPLHWAGTRGLERTNALTIPPMLGKMCRRRGKPQGCPVFQFNSKKAKVRFRIGPHDRIANENPTRSERGPTGSRGIGRPLEPLFGLAALGNAARQKEWKARWPLRWRFDNPPTRSTSDRGNKEEEPCR